MRFADDVVDRAARPTPRCDGDIGAMAGERGGDVGAVGLERFRRFVRRIDDEDLGVSASTMKGSASKVARAASRLPFHATSTRLKVVARPECGSTSTGRPAS